ncbi:MAG: hypothetical protein HXS41_09720 [Theionarchaea archaeon]|nr:hypothetical protein [Theionarchaea archaeon]MBU6999411.1 hypothetical protein [Theionarchaea archaeon]MBU7021322.1 hypothetical protein [Theionarchaea archaeon]
MISQVEISHWIESGFLIDAVIKRMKAKGSDMMDIRMEVVEEVAQEYKTALEGNLAHMVLFGSVLRGLEDS